MAAAMGVGSRAPGFYINIFQVKFDPVREQLHVQDSSSGPAVRQLRKKYEASGLRLRFHYSSQTKTTYAYGPDRRKASAEGFAAAEISLPSVPDLARRVMLDGFVDHFAGTGHKIERAFGRYTIVQPNPQWKSGDGCVSLFKGFDVNSVMWSDPRSEDLCFGLVVDLRWLTRDASSASLKPAAVAAMGLSLDVARAQGELLPGTAKINTEVARLHLEESILPFVKSNSRIMLGGGAGLVLDEAPVRIVVATAGE